MTPAPVMTVWSSAASSSSVPAPTPATVAPTPASAAVAPTPASAAPAISGVRVSAQAGAGAAPESLPVAAHVVDAPRATGHLPGHEEDDQEEGRQTDQEPHRKLLAQATEGGGSSGANRSPGSDTSVVPHETTAVCARRHARRWSLRTEPARRALDKFSCQGHGGGMQDV